MGRPKLYFTDEERKLAKKRYSAKYRSTHKEQEKEYKRQYDIIHKETKYQYDKEYRKNHIEEMAEKQRTYKKTQNGRAVSIANWNNKADKDRGYDITNNVTSKWVIENIFASKCVYCGETDWHLLGCDRIDNSKPHTADNVVCACGKCNVERGNRYTTEEFIKTKRGSV